MLALGKRMVLTTGAELFHLGDAADSIYLVARGRLRLTLPMQVRSHEEDVLVEERSSGQTVGWSALIPPYRFTLTATAPLETEVIALPREALTGYFAAHPDTGYTVSLEPVVASSASACSSSRRCGCARSSAWWSCAVRSRHASALLPAAVRAGSAGAPTAAKSACRHQRVGTPRSAAPAVLRRHFPVLQLSRRHAARTAHRRELTAMHTDIVLKHDETHRWCLDCHDANNRDVLHLASGEPRAVRRILPPLRPVPRRKVSRLARRRARPPHRQLERRQRATCCACTATIRTSRVSTRWRPSPRRGLPAGT